jgi:hypothetical protein
MREYKLTPTATCCPICLSKKGLILYSVDADKAAQHYVLRETDPERHNALKLHIESLWQKPTCAVVRCSNCQFCFADPYVAGDNSFYRLAYQHQPSDYPSWRWEFERTQAALIGLKRGGRLGDFQMLEIGAGDGAFTKHVAPDLTPKKNVLCTEYSDYGRNAIESYGVTCLPQDVRSLSSDKYADRFEVICMFQVLEHLDGLEELFSSLSRLSKGKSHLFISVPNAKMIEFNELNGALPDMPPNHIGRWSQTSFAIVAQRHGWCVVEHEVQDESPTAKVAQYIISLYMRKRQDPYTLANRIERVSLLSMRRALQALAAGWYALGSLRALYALLKNSELVGTQWAHLFRE